MNKNFTRRQALNLGLTTLAASLAPLSSALSDTKYPTQPIRLIVPRPAGGVVDVVGRVWGNQASTILDGTIVVDNIGGGGGTIGTAQAARATSDGHTLLLGSTSDLVLNPIIRPNLGYDPVKDFTPISIMAVSVAAIAVNASLPVHLAQGARGLCQGQSRQAVLRLGRRRNHGEPRGRTVQGTRRSARHRACAVQGRGAGHLRSRRRPHSDDGRQRLGRRHRSCIAPARFACCAAASERRVTAAPEIPTGAEAG